MPASCPIATSAAIQDVARFIKANWQHTVRVCTQDTGTLIGLPHPYTIPCRTHAFQELYYWDTYFTCIGLLRDRLPELAVHNTRNLLAQVARFGFVLNGNRPYCLSRSQPPYLAPLVELVAAATGETGLIAEAVPLLVREYEFWTTRRQTDTGLSHHGNHATREQLIEFFPTVRHRVRQPDARPGENLGLASRIMAECETGWDLNSRFERRCADFCPVDLNTNLFLYETLLARWSGDDQRILWRTRAEQRRDRLNTLCWDEDRGAWLDYDHVNTTRSQTLTAATFQPLWAGLATPAQAAAVVAKSLPALEHAFGLSSIEAPKCPGHYQWDHPNGWPCIQHLVYRGLSRYGYEHEARRIAGKYLASVTDSFAASGDLWEKYNVLDGTHETVEEAGYLINPVNQAEPATSGHAPGRVPPAMMGWTAGVFLDAKAFLDGEPPGDPFRVLPAPSDCNPRPKEAGSPV